MDEVKTKNIVILAVFSCLWTAFSWKKQNVRIVSKKYYNDESIEGTIISKALMEKLKTTETAYNICAVCYKNT